MILPVAEGPAGFFENPVPDGDDESQFIRNGDEIRGGTMTPARRQRMRASKPIISPLSSATMGW
jgi:hypothetical protein